MFGLLYVASMHCYAILFSEFQGCPGYQFDTVSGQILDILLNLNFAHIPRNYAISIEQFSSKEFYLFYFIKPKIHLWANVYILYSGNITSGYLSFVCCTSSKCYNKTASYLYHIYTKNLCTRLKFSN